MDDGLRSVDSEDQAIGLVRTSQELCKGGGFNLTKFTCNSKSVLETVPPEKRSQGLQELDLARASLPVERTLGVEWNVESDCFQFRITFQDKQLTKRGMLSTINSLFDPLGLVCPVTMVGKRILQDLCHENASWDDPVSEDVAMRWEMWQRDVTELSCIRIPRCYNPSDFKELKSAEMHHFSDASFIGYGACSYLKLTDVAGTVATSLVMGKAYVAPSKTMTIPRLELAAAVLATDLSTFIEEEIRYEDLHHVFWSDSRVVLGYIANNS